MKNSHGIEQSWLTVTPHCNNRCTYCYYGHSLSTGTPMKLERATAAIRLLLALGIRECAIVGGEPTTHPDLPAIIAYGEARGMSMGLVTNGRRLSNANYCDAVLSSGIERISISLEGAVPATHDAITKRPGSFLETVAGIDRAISGSFKPDIITTICRTNSTELCTIVDFVADRGLNYAVFNLCTPSLDPAAPREEILPLQEIATLLADLLSYADGRIPVSIVTPFPICLLRAAGIPRGFGRCQMFHGDGVTIDVDGSVNPCTHFSGASLFNLLRDDGHLDESAESFLARWTSSGADFRERLWNFPTNACQSCDAWSECLGGCPLFWTTFSPTSVLPDEIPTMS